MWIEVQKTDGQAVRLRADRVLAVSAAYVWKGDHVSHVYMVGASVPHSVLGTTEEITALIDEMLDPGRKRA